MDRFRDALADDFNTPRAMREVFDLVRAANQDPTTCTGPGLAAFSPELLELVGLGSLAETGEEGPDAAALELLEQRQKPPGPTRTGDGPTRSVTSWPISAGRSATADGARLWFPGPEP